MPPPPRFAAEQARRNRARDGHWQASANHRNRVSECLLSLTHGTPGRLCLLGAGNANDLDLPRLLAAYGEVHLVDLDTEALQRGVARQLPDHDRRKLHLHGGTDVTGICDALETLNGRLSQPSADLEKLIQDAADPLLPSLPGPFDVVASVGIISQLIDAVVRAVPPTAPHFMELLLSVRSGHLRLLARLTAPGGRGLLITDFVSSATVPELATLAEADLAPLAERLAVERNFFHGLNPLVVPSLFAQDAVLRRLIAGTRHRGYWLWD
ncbi:MAG: hypothetical protein B7Z73_18805, partial [Planctomycetia bacterium 21-64-5]